MIVLGKSVNTLSFDMFYGCTNVGLLYSYALTPPTIKNSTFTSIAKSIPVYVPKSKLNKYRSATYWNSFYNYQGACFWAVDNDSNWSNENNWIGNTIPNENDAVVIVANCIINDTISVSSLTVIWDDTLIIKGNGCLTVLGNLINDGSASNFIIEDNAQLFHNTANVQATKLKSVLPYTERNNEGWHLIASPLTNNIAITSVDNLLSNNYDLYQYDEPTLMWMNQKAADSSFVELEACRGYLYANSEEVVLEFAGTLKNCSDTMNIPLSYTETAGTMKGLNLVGNPFVCNAYLLDENNEALPFFKMNDTGDSIVAVQAGTLIKPCEGVFVFCPNDRQVHSVIFTTTAPVNIGEAQTVPEVLLPIHDLLVNQNAFLTNSVTQTISLSNGWNWFSPNVEITLEDLQNALLEALPGTAITIKSQTQNTTYNPNTQRWGGNLTWDVAKMYNIKTAASCEITLEGLPINPAEHPITIVNGVNWIGFPLNQSMSLTNAFAEFAVSGDKIKAQSSNALYNGGSWRGNLNIFEPGKGYMYISNVQDNRTFVFPANTK